MNRSDRRRQDKTDKKLIARGFDPTSNDPDALSAYARHLSSLFEKAKRFKNIDAPVRLIHEITTKGLAHISDIPVACKKGCSHCCFVWVSVSAPEIIYLSKLIRLRGKEAIDAIRQAHDATKSFGFEERPEHPHPCPLLVENLCSVYETRPSACRLAVSADAAICERAYHNLTNEDIPTPAAHLMSRTSFYAGLAIALKHANLPRGSYELISGLVCALDRDDAEEAWLAGEDVFSGALSEQGDLLADEQVRLLYEHTFGEPSTG